MRNPQLGACWMGLQVADLVDCVCFLYFLASSASVGLVCTTRRNRASSEVHSKKKIVKIGAFLAEICPFRLEEIFCDV